MKKVAVAIEDLAAAMEVIILGSGGGPLEDNTTALLVRSVSRGWNKGSLLAVDAGTHLAAITKILEKHSPEPTPTDSKRPVTLTTGPFKGLEIKNAKAAANASYITKTLVDTYLITHPHLDHISAFVVNTAALPASRPKCIAALPSTIEAFKNHIFNNIIWPNLSDENDGAGLVTYMRLVEGGSAVIGEGEGKGYVEVCDGLSVKGMKISHGHCIGNHSHHHPHRGSGAGLRSSFSISQESPRLGATYPRTSPRQSIVSANMHEPSRAETRDSSGVVDSSVYFIRDITSGQEIIIFGDTEPDSISFNPRNKQVWMEAAPKFASGKLKGIFIECSYDDSRPEDILFGHLAPRYLVEELRVLAAEVKNIKAGRRDSKKRKRLSNGHHLDEPPRRSSRSSVDQYSPISPLTHSRHMIAEAQVKLSNIEDDPMEETGLLNGTTLSLHSKSEPVLTLQGLKVVIIHVKDRLDDGEDVGGVVIEELRRWEMEARLGVEFMLPRAGEAVFL